MLTEHQHITEIQLISTGDLIYLVTIENKYEIYPKFLAIEDFLLNFLQSGFLHSNFSGRSPCIPCSVSKSFNFLHFELIISKKKDYNSEFFYFLGIIKTP